MCMKCSIYLPSTDLNDLKNFVNIALTTAAGGEDDLTRDKLSHLRTVGSGFGALIYGLPADAGYTELVERCRSLWETLSSTPTLPEIMVCSEPALQKLNGCFDLAVVILVAVLSDDKSLSFLVILRKKDQTMSL